ncbi:MAG: site-specific integrase [Nitrospira sp. SB0672_bin_25]|nr:site-specific integrase [Nitrospira sp. SB0672_bin_25]
MMTERSIREAKAGDKAFILWDSQIKGLGAKIFPGGEKSFVLSYRVNGAKRLSTIARVSELSLKAARERAGQELVRIRSGETDPLERRREAREAPTVNDLWDRFLTEYAPERITLGRMTTGTLKDYRNQAHRYLLPVLGRMKVRDVRRTDIERMARIMAHVPVQRNRTLAFASRLFTVAEHWSLRANYTNPCRGVVRAREEPRDRILSDSELAALGKTLTSLADRYPVPVNVIRFASVTGFRIMEAAGIQWSNINFERGCVTLPQTKVGRQVRALPPAALELLKSMPRINDCDFVFTTTGKVSVAYKHLDEVFKMVCQKARIENVRMHDLRRTVATTAAGQGVGLTVLRDLLGHKTVQMAVRYARQADSAVAAAVEQTGGNIASAMGVKPKAKIVHIRKRRHG